MKKRYFFKVPSLGKKLSYNYKNLYTIRGIKETPIITAIIPIPTGKRTPTLSEIVSEIGFTMAAVKVAPLSKPVTSFQVIIYLMALKKVEKNRHKRKQIIAKGIYTVA